MNSKLFAFWNQRAIINNHTFPPWNDEIHTNYQFYLDPENYLDSSFRLD